MLLRLFCVNFWEIRTLPYFKKFYFFFLLMRIIWVAISIKKIRNKNVCKEITAPNKFWCDKLRHKHISQSNCTLCGIILQYIGIAFVFQKQ